MENPPFVLCLGVCIAGGNKKYYSADGELATHSQIGFGIGIGAEFNDYGLGGYFIIQDIIVTNSNGEQFSGQGGAFSFTVPFVNFESSTTVNFNE